MPDLQTQLRQYAEELDDRYADVRLEEIIKKTTPPSRRRISVSRGVVIAVGAAIVILVLIGGVALLNLFGGSEPPVVTQPEQQTTTSGAVPTTIPSGIGVLEPSAVESVDTSLGRWTWTLYEGSLGELTEITPPLPDMPGDETPPADTPIPSVDGLDWVPIEATTASMGGVSVTAASRFGVVDWTTRFGENALAFWDYAARVLNVSDGETEHSLTIGVVRGSPDAVEFLDIGTNDLVFRLEATDPMIVAEQLTGEASVRPYWGPVAWSLHVDGDEASWVEPPWRGLAVDFVKAGTIGGEFLLVAVGRPPWEEAERSSILWSWRSADGRSWEAGGDPVRIDEIATGLELATSTDQAAALLTGPGSNGLAEANLVTLVDEGRWELVQANIEGDFHVEGFGMMAGRWVLAGDRQEPAVRTWVMMCDVRISEDARVWELLDYSPQYSDGDGTTATACYLSGDQVTLLEDFQDDGVRWIGGFGP